MNTLLVAALAYAARGWYVFPVWEFNANGCLCAKADCENVGKHPAVAWGREATTDAARIKLWWKERPQRGIGIVTGEKSGITVLDIDGEEGVAALGKLPGFGASGGLPLTPCVQSQPHHLHYYFKYTPDAATGQNTFGPHIDTRSNGGYVVAPPSPHYKSGGKYKWVQERAELAAWPTFLRADSGTTGRGRGKKDSGTREPFNPDDETEVRKVSAALEFVDADVEEVWAQVGWILGRAFRQADAGWGVYSGWAGRSRKWNAKRSRVHYYTNSKKPYEGAVLTTESIYKWATDAGWVWEDGRPVIVVKEGQLHVQVDAATAALAAAGDVYVRSGGLVEVITVAEAMNNGLVIPGADREVERTGLSPIFHSFDVDSISVKLNRVARFERNGVGIACPRSVAAGLLAVGKWEGVPPVRAITGSPFLRSNGSVCDVIGFDKASATMLYANGIKFPEIKDRPTRKEALKEIDVLREPFAEVPWKDKMHESAFFAFLLTLMTRPIMPTAPAFIFSAPKPGTGKTLLVDSASVIVHGTVPTHRSFVDDGDEQRKVLQSIMLAGDPVMLFDNVQKGASIGGKTLDTYLTSEFVGDRTLGRSETRRIVNSTCIVFTGNNIGARADFVRRALLVEIDAQEEQPHRRRFRIPNLISHIRENRGRYLRALLTMMRAFVCAGAPPSDHPPVGYFEAWDRAVSGCITWLGMEDPVKTQEELFEDDPDVEATGTLLRELQRMAPDKVWFTVDEVRRRVASSSELATAIVTACESVDRFGYWLRSHRDDIVNGLRLIRAKAAEARGSAKWRVEDIKR